jgi:malonate-semialdehyde dehydrogenase (acetylating)/methylmalonate-semialdehyde dehydrogenase
MSKKQQIAIKNYIHGEWVEGAGKSVPLYNPSTGEQIGTVPMSDAEANEAAVASSHAAYAAWRRLPLSRRIGYIFAMREAMLASQEKLAQSIALDQAKHISEARGEVGRVVQILEMACGIPALIQGATLDRISDNIVGRVIREPLGVFAGVGPFNFPALVFGWFIPFAIGVGNTFVYKPSTQSPYFMQLMGQLMHDIGLPKGVVNIIHGNRDIPTAWYPDPRIAGICLVGSTPTATHMAAECGRYAKRAMMLGGAKNYMVVMEDAQMEVFVPNFVNSCFGSAGQRCLAGSVVAVVPELYDSLLETMIKAGKGVTVGDAMDENVYMGPLISAKAKATVEEYIALGVKEGGRLILDGRSPKLPAANKNGYFVGPTILADMTPKMTVVQEEVFGPVVSVVRINDLDHALELIEAQPFGNGASLFTQNLYYTERFLSEVNVGMVGINVGVPAPHPYLPFGGIKGSLVGVNKVQGKDGIDFFTQNKVATVRFAHPKGAAVEICPATGKVRSCVAS